MIREDLVFPPVQMVYSQQIIAVSKLEHCINVCFVASLQVFHTMLVVVGIGTRDEAVMS